MGALPVDTCTRLDRLDQLLAHLADALRAKALETAGEKDRTGSNGTNEPTPQNNTEKSCSSCSKRSRLDPGESAQ